MGFWGTLSIPVINSFHWRGWFVANPWPILPSSCYLHLYSTIKVIFLKLQISLNLWGFELSLNALDNSEFYLIRICILYLRGSCSLAQWEVCSIILLQTGMTLKLESVSYINIRVFIFDSEQSFNYTKNT